MSNRKAYDLAARRAREQMDAFSAAFSGEEISTEASYQSGKRIKGKKRKR